MNSNQTGRTRLLLVEDEAIVALSEKKTLEKHGYEIVTAPSGEQAVQTATQDTSISLVLMDIDLGSGIDGTEAARQIVEFRSLPIVFLTSHAEKEYVDLVKKITNYGYVLKNSGEFVLIESIEMAFTLYEANTELKRQRENLQTALFQQENTEEALQNHVHRYQQLFDNIDSCVAVYEATEGGTNFIFVDINRAAENTERVRKEDVIGRKVTEVFPEVTPFGLLDVLKRVARSGTAESLPESRYSDSRVTGWRDNYVYKLPSGEVVAVYKDVTERKQTEEALLESRKHLEKIFNSARDAIYIHDLDGNFLEVNDTACEQLGYSKSELLNMTLFDIDNPIHRLGDDEIKAQLQQNQLAYLETEHITKSGHSFPVEISLGMIEYYGRPVVLAVSRDLTKRKEVEKKLEEMYTRLQTVIDSVPFLINEIDIAGHYLLVNNATGELLGVSKEQLIGKHFSEVLPRETADVFQGRIDEVCAGGEQLTVDDTLDLGGETRVFRSVLTPLLKKEYTVHSVVSIAYDVSQQLNALHQKDLLMRELNHRVKNNLHMVSSLIHLKESASGGEVDLSDLRSQVNAIEEVHKSLQESDDVTHIGLKHYVADILEGIFQTSPTGNITIHSHIPDISVETVTALPLGLIINETATNALKHGFSENGEHHFTVAIEQDSDAGEFIVTISNSGRPFPDDVDLENPQGLGLQLVSALVQQLQGTLTLRRKPQPEFTIRFPVGADIPAAGAGHD